MLSIVKSVTAVAAVSAVLLGTVTPSWAVRYRTPDPAESLFVEQLLKGERPIRKTRLTYKQKKALSAAPTASGGAASSIAAVPYSTTFYFSAHPDDFVLFMYPQRDVVLPDANVVFVFMTAGDAGLATGPSGAPYYAARENGASRAIRFMADVATTDTASPSSGRVTVNGHKIYRTVYKNTTAYFLRLPDGNGDGEGFAGDGYASLQKLKNGQISSIKAIDGSTTYTGWNDLVKTLGAIVTKQAVGTPNVWLNTHESDTSISPGDHSDHTMVGLATAAVQPTVPCVNVAYHVGYANSGLVNMDLSEIEDKSAAFANYASGMAEKGYPGVAWEPTHKSWLGALVLRIAVGNGAQCSF